MAPVAVVSFGSISIHALREESDHVCYGSVTATIRFQSTLSVRRATREFRSLDSKGYISIHALREESDR